MLFCFFIHRHSEFSPSFSGYIKNCYNYFASIFHISICSAFSLMCEMLSEKKIFKTHVACALWSPGEMLSAFLLNSLTEKGTLSGWFGTNSTFKKIKETLTKKDKSTSYIYVVRHNQEGKPQDGKYSPGNIVSNIRITLYGYRWWLDVSW